MGNRKTDTRWIVGAMRWGALLSLMFASIVSGQSTMAATPESDCADPAVWAAANGAELVELSTASRVAFLFGRTGPFAVVGSEERDVIVGSRGSDLICGGGGADVIWSAAGDDVIDAGAGRDIIIAGSGTDECSVDIDDVIRSCEETRAATAPTVAASVTAYRHDRLVTDTSDAPLVPLVSCVRERSDGLFEAVLGHRTVHPDSFYGSFFEVDESFLATETEALPSFFFEGEHPHTVAYPFDPADPPLLWLEPRDFRFANTAQWRFEIQLGTDVASCAPDVPAVFPILGDIPPTPSDRFAVSFVGSGPILVGGPDNHFFKVEPTIPSRCTGAAALPLEADYDMVFSDRGGLRPLSSAQTIATLGNGYVVSTTTVRTFSETGTGSTLSAAAAVSADLYPRCELADGTVVTSPRPVWYSDNTSNETIVGVTLTPATDGPPPTPADFSSTVSDIPSSGFSRFR